ncbi:MAG TPA: transferase [Polyangia bacterium]|jgi:serine O-acetyltransferase|nr:transferase [Polyangia bacterium]
MKPTIQPAPSFSSPTSPEAESFKSVPGQALPLGDKNQNPTGISFPALLAEDFDTHGRSLLSPGFWAVAVSRFGNWRMSVKPRALRPPLTVAYRLAHQVVIALWAIDLPYNARIGRRLRILHHGGFFLGARAMGDDVTIRHCATIGLIRKGADRSPIIGSRVEIGPGACIVGDISIGDDAFIGPNTVVAQDVPAGAMVLGNPARLVELSKVVEGPRPDRERAT